MPIICFLYNVCKIKKKPTLLWERKSQIYSKKHQKGYSAISHKFQVKTDITNYLIANIPK